MNIIFRHTLNSVSRNPVQSFIVVVSTAMITACVLVCLCISSMFGQISSGWTNMTYAGADVLAYAIDFAPMTEYIASQSDFIRSTVYSHETSASVMSATDSVRTNMIVTDDLKNFDDMTGAEILASCENTTDYPSAHISLAFSEAAHLSLGDTFTVKPDKTFTVTAICNNSARYFDQLIVVFVCEEEKDKDFSPNQVRIYLNDSHQKLEDGTYVAEHIANAICELYRDYSCAYANIDYTDNLMKNSVESSMTMMSVACAAIILIMACLLFASFSVIVRGRVNELVKFKAAGATPAQSTLILLAEAVFYALIGGLIGLGAGKGIILYLDGLLNETVANAHIVTEAYKYPLAFAIGAVCGVAACVIPALKMGAKSVRGLMGGEERITHAVPWWLAAIVSTFTLALAVAMFTAPTEAMLPVSALFVVFTLICIVTVMPYLLRSGCALAKSVTRKGSGYIAECAAPRNTSVNSTLTMLAALIAFITLGTGLIEIVGYTTVPASERYSPDFIVTLNHANYAADPVIYCKEKLAEYKENEGIEYGYISFSMGGYQVAPYDVAEKDKPEIATLYTYMIDDANALRYLSHNIDEDTIRRFSDTEHPVILPSYVVNKYGYKIGNVLSMWIMTAEGIVRMDNDFTLVGIDNTVTSWDEIIFTKYESMRLDGVLYLSEAAIHLIGDEANFVTLREKINSDETTVYKRDGYYPAEGGDKLDSSRLIAVFTTLVYGIAALGLVNLIVITAGERRREFHILHLCGMTWRDAARYIATETTILSFIGFVSGMIFAVLTNYSTKGIALIIDKYIVPDIFPMFILNISAAATGIFVCLWAISHLIAYKQISSEKYHRSEERLLRSD